MDLCDIIKKEAKKYEQDFLIVHVVSDAFYERFMITMLDRNFEIEKCYNVQTFVEMLRSRNIVPKKIGLANTPFGFVDNWVNVS